MALNFKLDRKSFKTALTHAARVTEKRNTIPILSCLRFVIEAAAVRIVATDLDIELAQELPAAPEGTGALVLPLDTLKAAVAKFTGESVRIEDMGGGKALLACCTTGARVILPTRADADWPSMTRGEMLNEFQMPTEAFAGAISSLKPCVSTEETRYYLNGVYMHRTSDEYGQDVIRFAATDGHRLGRVTHPAPAGTDELPAVIVPRKACKVLSAIAKGTVDCRVAVNRTKVEVRCGAFTLLTKTVDGSFPDYTRVIPYQNDVQLTVPAVGFASAVSSVSAVASEKTRSIAVSISSTEGVILTCTSPDNGRSAAIFESATVSDGAQLLTGFNAAYLAELLNELGGMATLQLADPAAPVRIEAEGRPELLYVLMPMRIGGAITTRDGVEALSMNPWEALRRNAEKASRGEISAAVEFLAGQEPRHVARVRVKAEIAEAKGNDAVRARLHRLLAAYDRQPSGSFLALPMGQFIPIEPVIVPEPVESVAAQGRVDGPIAPAANDDSPAADVVKVLTVTGQAVFVAKTEFANPAQRILQRYNRDGTPMGERVIHRDNIERLVPPRNRGDKPVARPAPAADGSVAERLARLEAIVSGLGAPARPKRTAAHVRAILAYLQLRKVRTSYRVMSQLHSSMGERWEREKVRVGDAIAERDRLQRRCDALERLHTDSEPLDTAAIGLNSQPHPAIILPIQRTSARAS